MCVGIAFVQSERSRCGLLHFWIRLERSNVLVGQPVPCLCDPRPRSREIRIFVQRLLEQTKALSQALLVALVREVKTLQIKTVRFRVFRCTGGWGDSELNL